jgi:hypothetical protein
MADHQVPPQTINHWHLPENPLPPPVLHQPHGHVQQHVVVRVLMSSRISHDKLSPICPTLRIPHEASDGQQYVHRDGIHLPIGNGAMQGQIQYPHRIDEPHYNAGQHHPPPHVSKTLLA